MILDGSRAEALASLDVPTLVEDMGHDRPRALWPLLVDAIAEHTRVS